MSQPSFGLGAGIAVDDDGKMIRFRDRYYAAVILHNAGPDAVYVLVNTHIEDALSAKADGVDDIDTSNNDAKFKEVTVAYALANGILMAPDSDLQLSGYSSHLGDAGIGRVAVIAAAGGAATVSGGSNDVT